MAPGRRGFFFYFYILKDSNSGYKMRYTRKILLLFLIFFLAISFAFSEGAEGEKNILILYSMVPSTPAYRVMTDDIRTSLTQAYGDGFTLHMEYLETERYPIGEYPVERFDIINEKYSDINLDLLICIGIDIIGTIKAHADTILLNLPTAVNTIDSNRKVTFLTYVSMDEVLQRVRHRMRSHTAQDCWNRKISGSEEYS